MYTTIASLVERLDDGALEGLGVIPWAAPVPFFGDLSSASVATVGINPSQQEFVDATGRLLVGHASRLPTLATLGLEGWAFADHHSLKEILRACGDYFRGNPYMRWFGVLERLLNLGRRSYYGSSPSACHLDLVPFATQPTWGGLSKLTQAALVDSGARWLGLLVRDSPVQTLLLNGRAVVELVQTAADERFIPNCEANWDLPRASGRHVRGCSYRARVQHIGGVDLGKPVNILGWNHNLQSSFGVTGTAIDGIGAWVADVLQSRR